MITCHHWILELIWVPHLLSFICTEKELFSEVSVVAVDTRNDTVIAVGKDAFEMVGKTRLISVLCIR